MSNDQQEKRESPRENLFWHDANVRAGEREKRLGQAGSVVWFTGLSGSGKSTIAVALDQYLFEHGYTSYILDGDNIRHALNSDLGFSDEDRKENIRRIAHVSRLFADAGLICITAFISPFRTERALAREIQRSERFVEVYVKAPLDVCEKRDPKGLYKKARAGEIPQFTGISSPYEAPEKPELVISTDELTVEQSAEKVATFLKERGILKKNP